MTITACQYDSGSMYGNRPLCAQKATHIVTYRNGSGAPMRTAVCARHLGPMQGRVYPGLVAAETIGQERARALDDA